VSDVPSILVVEDNPITRKMVRAALETKGYRVFGAPDGATAERLASETKLNLCLLDLVLPDVSGCDLLAKLRSRAGGDRMPVIAFSGFVSKLEELKMSAAGFDDILLKPIDPSRLLQVVRAHLPEDRPSTDRFGEGRRLVVVDDDPIQLKLVSIRLGRHGFDTLTANDGEQALEMARRTPPDAIVSDVLMPRVDGFQLCREALQDPKLASVPVVLVTNSYVETHDRELARGVGAVDLVLRTPDLKELTAALRSALSRSRPPPRPDDASLTDLDAQRTKRALVQLERQVVVNASLSQRCASFAAELEVLRGISAALAEGHDSEAALDAVLAACLDAGGISQAGLFVLDPLGKLVPRSLIGDSRAAHQLARLLEEWAAPTAFFTANRPLVLTEPECPPLRAHGLGSALIVPLQHRNIPLGALVLAAHADELTQEDRLTFWEAVANQMALAMTVAGAFNEQAISRRQAREGEAMLRSILESIPDAVLVVDRTGRVTHFNRAAEHLALAHGADTTPEQWAEGSGLYLPDQRTRCPTAELPLVRALNGETVHRAEFFSRTSERSEGAWLSVNAHALRDRDDRIWAAVAVYRDVTAERDAQAQLMASDRLASMGMLAAGFAHEINNPLSAIVANVELALADVQEQPGDWQAERLSTLTEVLTDARDATWRVRDIVRDVRIFSRSEDQTPALVDVRRVLDSSLRMAWNEIRHRATVVREYADVPPVLANEARLGQALLNLVINAAQAIAPGHADRNEIHVRAEMVHKRIMVAVRDSGSGMPPDVVARLFTPFFTTKPRNVGTGLGLAITQRIIASLDGEIEVESLPGRGTTIRVYLPPAPPESAVELVPPAPVASVWRRGCVLVIDDEPFVGNAVRRVLSSQHEVFVESTGRAALARVAGGEQFDAILCDVMMPVMTGMDVHAELLRVAPDHAEKLVFLTGGALSAEARDFLASVPNPKVDKPFDPRELRDLIARMVR
jgi:CheY-like chemotaxis protein/signal transduction histidine kinase